MKYVKQELGPTCGIACYAMITGITFKKAYKKIKRYMNNNGINTINIVRAFRAANYKIIGCSRLRPVGKRSWNDLPNIALVKVRPDGCSLRNWHWVVWNGEKVYDPAMGVKTPEEYIYDPISFLEISV